MRTDPRKGPRIRDADLMKRLHLELAGEPCQRCELRPGTQLHHHIYRSQGGDDVRQNFVWLCNECHRDLHGGY